MARALKDILTELDAVYKPQKDLYATQASALDPALAAEEQGLQAQKRDEFQGITERANRRGMFYSGIPIQEEQRYVGSQFLPAVANLRSKYSSQRFGLQDAIAKITADQYGAGMGIWQKELDRDEEARRFSEQLAAQERSSRAASAASGFSPGLGYGGGGSVLGASEAPQPPTFQQRLATLLPADYATRFNPGYTERTVMTQLQKDFPQFSPEDIKRQVYAYRKQYETPSTASTVNAINSAIGRR